MGTGTGWGSFVGTGRRVRPRLPETCTRNYALAGIELVVTGGDKL